MYSSYIVILVKKFHVKNSSLCAKWYEVMFSDHLQVTLPDGSLQRIRHSTTAITLCPGLVEVIVFGGTTEDYVTDKPYSSYSRIAETTIITFGELD